ncbi:MAG: RNA polymerase subunit sigma-70 [Bacteroidetes bacterium SW_11_45_7]|nr:MAG: RNA polymerase subunit sigma-70 [Bacteroidetes bacterium SW_11_45_7]
MKTNKIGQYQQDEVIDGCVQSVLQYQKALYNHFAPKMFGLCLRYAKDYHTAEDILQEGFVKVFKYIKNFRKEGSLEGWLRRIFINTAIEHFRKAVRVYPILDDEETEIDIEDDYYDLLDSEDLIKMVQQLSPGYRTIFNLYAVEGYSHKEIAKLLGISEGTSKSQLARARTLLKKMVEEADSLPGSASASSR